MFRFRVVLVVVCIGIARIAAASAQTPLTQLDRIEQKLDTILHRLDQLQPGQAPGAQPAQVPLVGGQLAPLATTPSPAPETLAAGAVAIIHAAPVTALAAREIPTDSVGGFIYTGGSLQLADLKDHGVHYTGLAGVEWQGWLRAKEAGRYELELDGSTASPNNFTNSTCVFAGWLQDRSIGVQEANLSAGIARPAPFSLILGATLSPGLYKLRLWATCTPSVHNQRVSVDLLEKAPSDLNLRPVTGMDLVHKPGVDHHEGSLE
jgi:hypothetical protein